MLIDIPERTGRSVFAFKFFWGAVFGMCVVMKYGPQCGFRLGESV